MKEIIENVISYKLTIGQAKEDILSGIFHTVCERLELTHAEALLIIRRADDQKAISDAVLKSYQPDHHGLHYNSVIKSKS